MRLLFFILSFCLTFPAWAISESNISRLIEKAPEINSSENLPQLVESLTKSLKKEEDKAYVLLAWIVKNIDYDNYKLHQIEILTTSRRSRAKMPDNADILKTRLGVCWDIANLYQKMLTEAKMTAVTINGCLGEINKTTKQCKDGSSSHSWNAVWIKDQWEFVDPTLAITGKQVTAMDDISQKNRYDKELKKREKKSAHTYKPRENRSVNKKWFMTPARTMQEDHQPEDEKWLLIKVRDRKNKNL